MLSPLCWCTSMAINLCVLVLQYNGGFLPMISYNAFIILLTLSMLPEGVGGEGGSNAILRIFGLTAYVFTQ